MKKITFTLLLTIMSLGITYSQTVVTPVLYLPFDTEKVPDGEPRVSIVDSTEAVHPNPTTDNERWLEYPGGALVTNSQLADTTMDRGTVLAIDDHSFLKVEEGFFEGKDQWTISYWYRWIRPTGWWTSHGQWLGTAGDTLVGGWTHWKGWLGKGEFTGLGGLLGNNNKKFANNDWMHFTITYHDSTLTYYIADSLYSQGVFGLKNWETNSYWLSLKAIQADNQHGWQIQVNNDSTSSYCQEAQIDDFRLFDIALTNDEVVSLHNDETIERIYISSVSVGTESGETEVNIEDSLQMTADISPADASWPDVEWSVEEGTGSAMIDYSGMLTPIRIGTVTVKATATDGSGVTTTKEITITGTMVSDITVSSANSGDSVKVDNTMQMSVEVSPDDAADKTVSWSIVNGTGVAVIDDNGVLVAVLAGTVNVIATANDGSGTADTLEVIIYDETSNIEKPLESDAVTVYPNPSHGTFNIILSSQKPVEYSIYNVIGKKIQSGMFQSGATLELNSIDKGIYYLKLDTHEGVAVKKLIVN